MGADRLESNEQLAIQNTAVPANQFLFKLLKIFVRRLNSISVSVAFSFLFFKENVQTLIEFFRFSGTHYDCLREYEVRINHIVCEPFVVPTLALE